MKKFKHKKTGEIATYKDGILKIERCCVEIGVEPSSEFWEEVVEKDYEILTVITNNGKFIEIVYNQSATIEPFWKIHSVKRKSDGEVFSIGDTFNLYGGTNNYIIKSFLIEGNILYVYQENFPFCSQKISLPHLIKSKSVLFKTFDGVDIYEGDKIYTVFPNFCIGFSGKLNFKPSQPCFSTQEAAQEYILMNKPCLSINDVNNWYSYLSYESATYNRLIENLKQLVKSKL